MKAIFVTMLFLFLGFTMTAQASFSVAVVPSKLTYDGTGQVDIYGNPEKGANFVLTGYIYRGDYFENNCPDNQDCGIVLVLTQDTVYALPETPGDIIGRWDFRGFSRADMAAALNAGGIPTYSTQNFTFTDSYEECPGCTLVTEGKDLYGGDDNVYFKKSIVGGTTEEFRLMRGEVDQIIFKQPENKNETGGYNMKVTFKFFKN